jgi:cyanate permease
MLPGIAMYVYVGTLAGDLALAHSGGARSNPAHWALEILGLLATVAAVIYVTYLARNALKQKASREENLWRRPHCPLFRLILTTSN